VRSPRALACPQCGGSVAPPLATRRVVCRYCGRAHYYAGEDFLPTLVLPPTLSESALRDTVLALFRSRYLPADFARRALLVQARRSYLPFYLLTGKRGGLLTAGNERVKVSMRPLGMESEISSPYGGRPARYPRQRVETVREEDTRVVLGDFRYLYCAAATPDWQFLDEDLRREALAHLEEAQAVSPGELAKEGEVLDPDIPLAHLVEKGVAAREAKGDLKILDLQPTLLYLPFQTLTVRYGSDYYTVRVDERSGLAMGGRLPFRRDWAHLMGIPLVAGMGWLTGLALKLLGIAPASEWVRVLLTPPAAFVIALALLIPAGLVAAGLSVAWSLVRRPYSVGVSQDGLRIELDGPVPESPLQPFTEGVWTFVKLLLESGGRRP